MSLKRGRCQSKKTKSRNNDYVFYLFVFFLNNSIKNHKKAVWVKKKNSYTYKHLFLYKGVRQVATAGLKVHILPPQLNLIDKL